MSAATAESVSRPVRGSGLRGLLPLVALLGLWELLGSPDAPLLPAPSAWGLAVWELVERGRLAPELLATLRTFATGVGLATVLGAALGLSLGKSPATDRALGPALEFARALPPAAMVPVATLLLGFGETAKVVVVVIAALWPVLLNTRTAVRGLDRTLIDTAHTLQLGRLDRLGKVVGPALWPSIVLGVRVAAPIALVITLLVEILVELDGLGALITESQRTFRSARAYGLIGVAGVISLVVHYLVGALERLVLGYRRSA
ncbi:MAG: hypothetical protein BRC32_07400 [Actinobacteria bacterium QS_8_72_14]|nr:MAG: hypothetical protein BRC32_07400 [Actinobacteria bacterium QS_8_72_14]